GRSLGQQRDRQIDQNEAAEAEQRAGDERQAHDQRVDVHVLGEAGAYSESLAVGAVQAEPGRLAGGGGGGAVGGAHARIPTIEFTSCAETARLLTNSRPLMSTAAAPARACFM